MNVLVLAKAPVAGEVKTRLSPPYTPEQAATLARAALMDTLEVVRTLSDVEPVLVLAGEPGPWLPEGFRVIAQRGDGLDERLAAAFDDAGAPAFLVGMDTPQLTTEILADAVERTRCGGVDAVLGLAPDGGWWGIGLRRPDARVFVGVPMSRADTGAAQLDRLAELCMTVDATLPVLRDVDDQASAVAVAVDAPQTRFAAALASVPAGRVRTVAPVVLGAVGAVVVAAVLRGQWLRDHGLMQMFVNAPPLTGRFDPSVGPRALAAVVAGALGVWWADRLVARLRWRALLVAATIGALLWAVALAYWDAIPSSLWLHTRITEGYAQAVPLVGDPGTFLRGFVGNIREYSAHVQAHPPGLVLVLWALAKLGLGGSGWEVGLQLVGGAASVPAVLLTVRDVAGEHRARAAAPFLVLAPIAVAFSSGDAIFLGVGAWGVACLVLATSRRGGRAVALAAVGGAIGGVGLMLSYGLVLLAAVPLAVIVWRRRWDVAAIGATLTAAVLGAFAAAGFWWLGGLAATRELYHQGIASIRPYSYFVWADLAAVAIAVGPAVWVGLARLRDRRLWLLAGSALLAIMVADLSGLSKAEVERIWLPYTPWLLAAAGTVFISVRERRGWLAAQVGAALVVQALVRSVW